MADGRIQASPELPPHRGLSLSRRCQSAHRHTAILAVLRGPELPERAPPYWPCFAGRCKFGAGAGIGFSHGRYSPYAAPPRRRPDLTWHTERRLGLALAPRCRSRATVSAIEKLGVPGFVALPKQAPRHGSSLKKLPFPI